MVQLSHLYMTTGKTIALTRRTFVGKVMSLLFNVLSIKVCVFTEYSFISFTLMFTLPVIDKFLVLWLLYRFLLAFFSIHILCFASEIGHVPSIFFPQLARHQMTHTVAHHFPCIIWSPLDTWPVGHSWGLPSPLSRQVQSLLTWSPYLICSLC